MRAKFNHIFKPPIFLLFNSFALVDTTKKSEFMCLPPAFFVAMPITSLMSCLYPSILSPSRVTRQTSHFSVAPCVALHGDTYHTTHINLHSSRVMSHVTHLTSQFAHVLRISHISIHCPSPHHAPQFDCLKTQGSNLEALWHMISKLFSKP